MSNIIDNCQKIVRLSDTHMPSQAKQLIIELIPSPLKPYGSRNSKVQRNAENAERYQKEGWDLASTYVLRPHLGIKWSQISDDAGKNLEKDWNEGVRKDYWIIV